MTESHVPFISTLAGWVSELFRKLTTRLALSHILPVLVFIPLLGLALLYQLEHYYLLDNLAVELVAQGTIIAEFTREQPVLWQDPQLAQVALDQLQQRISAHLMLIDSAGRIIAATWLGDGSVIGSQVESSVVMSALGGQPAWTVNHSPGMRQDVIDVAVPVSWSSNRIIGVVRLSASLDEIQRRLAPMRGLVLVTLLTGATLSLVSGLVLARSIGVPLVRLTKAVARFDPAVSPERVPERGPDEIRALAATYNRMSRRLHELERSRSALLSGIVHELGRPLGAIKAAAQTIQINDDLSLHGELADGIDHQVDQLRLHLEDLALLGEVELQGLRLNLETVDMTSLLRDLCKQFQPLALEKRLVLLCDLDRGLPLLHADAKRVSQIVGNLIHNACKYTPSGGNVEVAAYPVREAGSVTRIEVIVADTGPGIAPSEHEEIFQLFYRSPSQRHLHQGVGIGLALARQLAEAHGGTLVVASSPGAGATFTLSLPLGDATPAAFDELPTAGDNC